MSKAITFHSPPGYFHDIIREIGVTVAVGEGMIDKVVNTTYWTRCLWDTGASHTMISNRCASILKLEPFGDLRVITASGEMRSNAYMVGLTLPGLMNLPLFAAAEYRSSDADFDVIVGMDIICMGDFAITNLGGRSTFSFRYPSLETIDFSHSVSSTES